MSDLLATGNGAELTEDQLPALVADTLGRPVDVPELAAPIEFSLAILTLTGDPTIHDAVIRA